MSRGSGFTLIEVLLVVVIIGIAASLVAPGFSATRISAKDEATRIAGLLDHAQTLASLRGVPIAWQMDSDGYGFLDWRGQWQAKVDDSSLRHRQLPPGIRLEWATTDAEPLLVFPPNGFLRPFSLRVSSVEGAWNVVGDTAGRIRLAESADAAPAK